MKTKLENEKKDQVGINRKYFVNVVLIGILTSTFISAGKIFTPADFKYFFQSHSLLI